MFFHEWTPSVRRDAKLVFGLLFSLKQLNAKLSPVALSDGQGGQLSLSTDSFSLHALETPSGLRFVLLTEVVKESLLDDVHRALKHVYTELFTGLVIRSPLYVPGAPVTSAAFSKQVDSYLAAFAQRLAAA